MKTGWACKKLGEICDIERGGSPRPIQEYITTSPDGVNWIKIGDATASGKYIYKTEEKIKPEGVKRSRMVYEGDFILSNSMSFGRPYIMKTSGCIHDGWLVLHQPKVDPDYLYYVLSSDLVFQQFDRLAAGSTVRNLNIGLAQSVEIPYPPLPEQRRIVGILDEAFDGIAAAKKNSEMILRCVRDIVSSQLERLFAHGISGDDGDLLSSCVEFVTYGFTNPMPSTQAGPFMVTAKNVVDGRIDYEEARHTSQHAFDTLLTDKSRPKVGDVLLTKDGTLGRLAVVDRSGICINQSVAVLRPNGRMTPHFMKYLLSSPSYQSRMIENADGATIKHIYITRVDKMPVTCPPIAVQDQVVSQLDALSSATRKLEANVRAKLAALDELKKSLLHKAFAGEL